MNLAAAQVLAEQVRVALEPLCEKVVIAGSIRRGKAEVNDVDVVAMPKCVFVPGALGGLAYLDETAVWLTLFPRVLKKKLGLKAVASGKELLRFEFPDGFQVDVYRARAETWGVILLVRTGSKEHNVKLCSLARSKGYTLSASQGVLDGYGEVMASCTEERIFEVLGLAFVEPKDREVR